MTTEGNAWLYKNKDHGMMSAAASLGTILLWNVEEGLTQVQYSYGMLQEAGHSLRVFRPFWSSKHQNTAGVSVSGDAGRCKVLPNETNYGMHGSRYPAKC